MYTNSDIKPRAGDHVVLTRQFEGPFLSGGWQVSINQGEGGWVRWPHDTYAQVEFPGVGLRGPVPLNTLALVEAADV